MYNRKPLIDLGTLGVKANVQVVVPFLTESYCSIDNPPEISAPIDIVLNFPNTFEDTIQWAYNKFRELFIEIPEQAQEYMLDSQAFVEQMLKSCSESHIDSKIDKVKQILEENRPKTFADCIKWVSQKHCTYSSKYGLHLVRHDYLH